MRRYFAWMAVALVVASVAAGCSSGGDDAAPSVPGVSGAEQAAKFSVKDFENGDVCRLVVSTNDTTADSRELQSVKLSADVFYTPNNLKEEVVAKEGTSAGQAPVLCGFCKASSNIKAESFDALQSNSSAKATIPVQPRWQGQEAGHVETLWQTFSNEPVQVTVAKVLDDSETKHCNILSYTVSDADGRLVPAISHDEALAIAQVFDTANPADREGKGIYERITSTCGNEWSAGGGRDGDHKINIVLLDNIGSDTSIVFGYVTARDLLPAVDPNDTKADQNYSNAGEYVYLNYGTLGSSTHTVASTLAHEFTHLTQLNQKIAHDGSFVGTGLIRAETQIDAVTCLTNMMDHLSLTEGLAEVGADLCGLGVYYAKQGTDLDKIGDLYSLDAIYRYLNGASVVGGDGYVAPTQFPTAFFDSEMVDAYGLGHLFGLHVWGYYGEDKLSELYKSPLVGVELLENVLNARAGDILHRYDLGLVLSGASNVPSDYEKYVIPFVNIGGDNFYLGNDGAAASLAVSRAVPTYKVYPKLEPKEISVIPWSNIYADMICQTTSTLNVTAQAPGTARINLIHETSSGVVKNIY